MTFFERPLSAGIMVVAIILILLPLLKVFRRDKKQTVAKAVS
jgi:TctA family transporter